MFLMLLWIVTVVLSVSYAKPEGAVLWIYYTMLVLSYLYISWSIYDFCIKDADIDKLTQISGSDVKKDSLCLASTMLVGLSFAFLHSLILFIMNAFTVPTLLSITTGVIGGNLVGKLFAKLTDNQK